MDGYDPERFRRMGHRVIDLLADHLARTTRREGPVLPWREPAELVAAWADDFAGVDPANEDALVELLARTVAESHHLHHPRYVGHQVTAPLPELALCRLTGALLNNGMAVYEMGPVSTAMERVVVRWLADALRMGGAADGVLTNGGSMGNLTALLAARQIMAGHDVWDAGAHAGPPLAVLVASTAHYSVARALQIMGWGAAGAIPVPVDEQFRLRPDALAEAKRRAEAAGRKVIAVSASAASTGTGAFDPLHATADFCEAHGLWFHVDGCHGAAAALSPRHHHLVAGIERADSVVWDAHKMLLVPALATAVLFREGKRSYAPFAQQASYLLEGEHAWWDLAARTLECTKRMIGLDLYAALRLQGGARLGEYVARCFDRAAGFAARLAEAPDFDVVPPQANIVCFRYRPRGLDEGPELDALQDHIRDRLVKSGDVYLVRTRLPGGVHLRVTVINPLTTDEDLAELLDRVRGALSG